MKNILLMSLLLLLHFFCDAQIIATVELEEPVESMCGKVMYALFSGFDNQKEPECNYSKEELVKQMTDSLEYLKSNPKTKAKGILGLFINCEGVVIQSQSGLKDTDSELSKQMESFLLTFGEWTAGEYNGKPVDSSVSISYKIKNGIVYLD